MVACSNNILLDCSMENTTRLKLLYLMAAQAQKHVTHNEALRQLDALVHLSVKENGLNAAPSEPSEGDRYIIGPNPTERWSGKIGHIASYQDGFGHISCRKKVGIAGLKTYRILLCSLKAHGPLSQVIRMTKPSLKMHPFGASMPMLIVITNYFEIGFTPCSAMMMSRQGAGIYVWA